LHSTAAPHGSLVRGAEAGQPAGLGGAVGAVAVGQVGLLTPLSVVVRQPPCKHVNQELQAGLKSPPYSHAAFGFEHALPTAGSIAGHSGAPAPTNAPGASLFGSLLLDEQARIASVRTTEAR